MMTRYPLSLILLLVAALSAGLAACGDYGITDPDYCQVRKAAFTPADSVMQVGDTVTFHAAFIGSPACWPADTTSAALRWTGADSAVALDSLTGHATALKAGVARLEVRSASTHYILGDWEVTVQP